MGKMKLSVISRKPEEYLRETKHDIHKIPRNFDPNLHPFEGSREYVRALNATKLDRVFAKPFVGNFDGHRDGVSCLAKNPGKLSFLLSGAFDGEIIIWNTITKKCLKRFVGHEGIVRSLTYTCNDSNFLTVGDDKTIKTWGFDPDGEDNDEPLNTILSKSVVTCISHHRKDPIFATCGEVCQLWESSRNEPIKTFKWGVDSLHDISFNLVETNLLSACASDRSIILYDTRETGPMRKLVMNFRTNKLCWNPMQAYIFTCASEDYNLYSFDSRNLKQPQNIHTDHTAAVTTVDYSPTGKEFTSGSYDKTIRIYDLYKSHSRDIYHTKRMQRVTSVKWSLDNKYIFSASDEMNIRIWKSKASEKLGIMNRREKIAMNYNEALKEKFASHPQIRRIARHRQIPKHVYNAQREIRSIKEKMKRKERNLRLHSKPGTVPVVPERKKHIVREDQ